MGYLIYSYNSDGFILYTDKRVDGFYLMSSPFPTLLICAGYIYFIKYLGPRLMRDRRPFELKGVIIFYNIIQLLLNIYLVYKVSKYTYTYLYIQYIQLIYVSNSILAVGTRLALALQFPLPGLPNFSLFFLNCYLDFFSFSQ